MEAIIAFYTLDFLWHFVLLRWLILDRFVILIQVMTNLDSDVETKLISGVWRLQPQQLSRLQLPPFLTLWFEGYLCQAQLSIKATDSLQLLTIYMTELILKTKRTLTLRVTFDCILHVGSDKVGTV